MLGKYTTNDVLPATHVNPFDPYEYENEPEDHDPTTDPNWCDECEKHDSAGDCLVVTLADGDERKLCANHWVEWLTRNMDRAEALPKIQLAFGMTRNEAATEWTDAEQRQMVKCADACVGMANELVEVMK